MTDLIKVEGIKSSNDAVTWEEVDGKLVGTIRVTQTMTLPLDKGASTEEIAAAESILRGFGQMLDHSGEQLIKDVLGQMNLLGNELLTKMGMSQ